MAKHKGEIASGLVGLGAAAVIAALTLAHRAPAVSLSSGVQLIPLTLDNGQSVTLQPAATSSAVLRFDPTLSTPQGAQSAPSQGAPASNNQLQPSSASVLQNPATGQ